MGRGLSDLQRFILTEANRRRAARLAAPPEAHHNGVDLYRHHVMSGFFGWTPSPHSRDDLGSGRRFRPCDVGHARYDAVQSSVTKAVNRLAARGLVAVFSASTSWWSGVGLTDQGVETAERLSAKSMANLPQTQPLDQPEPAQIAG